MAADIGCLRFLYQALHSRSFRLVGACRRIAVYDPGGVSVGDLCGVCVVAACPGVGAAFFLRVNVLRGVLVVSVVLASLLEVVHLSGLRSVSQEGVALAKRIEAQVPTDGFVLYEIHVVEMLQPYPWFPYLTWRRSVYTPIPASDNRQFLRQIREEIWRSKLSRIP